MNDTHTQKNNEIIFIKIIIEKKKKINLTWSFKNNIINLFYLLNRYILRV